MKLVLTYRSNCAIEICGTDADVSAEIIEDWQKPIEGVSKQNLRSLRENLERQINEEFEPSFLKGLLTRKDYDSNLKEFLNVRINETGFLPEGFIDISFKTNPFDFIRSEMKVLTLFPFECLSLISDQRNFREEFQHEFLTHLEISRFLLPKKMDLNTALNEYQIGQAFDFLTKRDGSSFKKDFLKFFSYGIAGKFNEDGETDFYWVG